MTAAYAALAGAMGCRRTIETCHRMEGTTFNRLGAIYIYIYTSTYTHTRIQYYYYHILLDLFFRTVCVCVTEFEPTYRLFLYVESTPCSKWYTSSYHIECHAGRHLGGVEYI